MPMIRTVITIMPPKVRQLPSRRAAIMIRLTPGKKIWEVNLPTGFGGEWKDTTPPPPETERRLENWERKLLKEAEEANNL